MTERELINQIEFRNKKKHFMRRLFQETIDDEFLAVAHHTTLLRWDAETLTHNLQRPSFEVIWAQWRKQTYYIILKIISRHCCGVGNIHITWSWHILLMRQNVCVHKRQKNNGRGIISINFHTNDEINYWIW